jgi:hypothetical protein
MSEENLGKKFTKRDLQQHPAMVSGINNMIRQGYSKDAICRITGAAPETVEHHQRTFERQTAPAASRTYTEGELREIVEKIKKGKP